MMEDPRGTGFMREVILLCVRHNKGQDSWTMDRLVLG